MASKDDVFRHTFLADTASATIKISLFIRSLSSRQLGLRSSRYFHSAGVLPPSIAGAHSA